MAESFVLAYDVGTSGTKAAVISSQGRALDAQSCAHLTHYGPGGIAEQNPEDWWQGVAQATRAILARNPSFRDRIAAIGVSGHMLGCVPIDAQGAALGPAMIHSDGRAAAQFEKVRDVVGLEPMYRLCGNVLDPRSTLCKILWIRDNEPQRYRRAHRFLQSKDYVVSRLTGNLDATDYSDACHAQLMDIHRRQYDRALLKELGLSAEKLPALHRSRDIVGRVTGDCAAFLGLQSGIPVIAGGGDGACGCAGAGNVCVGDAYLSLGTTAWIAQVTSRPVIDPLRRVFNVVNLDGETCSVCGTTQSAGSATAWIMRLLGIDGVEELNRLATSAPPGADGLVFLPYLDGERSPVFDVQARGTFVGIAQAHGRSHFARAVFEGVSFALANILSIFRERDALPSLRVIGGGGNSKFWRQMLCDICRVDLETLNVPAADATSLGVAAAAAVAVGMFRDMREATCHIRADGLCRPQKPDPRYARNYQVYCQLYPALKQAMHHLAQ